MKIFPLLLLAIPLACLPVSADGTPPETYDVVGVVKKLKPDIRTAVIDHEKIPGYMDAMVMSLEVRDAAELEGINPGDKIRFRMNVTEDDGWIDRLKVIEEAKTPVEVKEEPEALEPIVPGEPLPDASLTDDSGKSFKLSDYRGQGLAVTFIYTRCPFPNFCPRINRRFQEVQEILKNDPAAPENWRLLSISIEPGHDTPEVLSAFAKRQEADPDHWKFATGTLRDITKLAVQSGLDFWDDRGVVQHNLRTIVVDPSGKVAKVFGEEDFTAAELAVALRSAAETEACPCEEEAAPDAAP